MLFDSAMTLSYYFNAIEKKIIIIAVVTFYGNELILLTLNFSQFNTVLPSACTPKYM